MACDHRPPHTMNLKRDTLQRPVLEKNIPNVKIVEDIQREKPFKERRRRDTDNEGYEEISSDENDLDEDGEKPNKRTIVSVLDIDLASLLPSTKPKITAGLSAGPVFQRYKAANVFAQLGLSRTFAGDNLYRKVQNYCENQMDSLAKNSLPDDINTVKDESLCTDTSPTSNERTDEHTYTVESNPDTVSIKEEIPSTPSLPAGVDEAKQSKSPPSTTEANQLPALEIKLETGAAKAESKTGQSTAEKDESRAAVGEKKDAATSSSFELYSDSPAVHQLIKSRNRERTGLFNTSSLLTRALTARKDLDLRRRLCQIPHRYDQNAVYPSGAIDPDLFNQCMQLFKQNRPIGLAKPRPMAASASS